MSDQRGSQDTDDSHNSSIAATNDQHGMTVWETGLALLSAIIGGGIVGIPYAMFKTGIILGLILNVVFAMTTIFSARLYLRCKDISPMYVESLYELSYIVIKRAGIFLFATVVLISGTGCIMIYFIVFGDISASLVQKIQGEGTHNFFSERPIYVITLAVLMLPMCLKK